MMRSLWGIAFCCFVATQAFATEIVSSSSKVQALIGGGYTSQKEKFVGKCVEGDVLNEGTPQATFSFTQLSSTAQLADSLGFSLGTSFRYGLVSVTASAKFFSSNQNTSHSLSAVYHATYRFKNRILDKIKLTDVGKSVRDNDERWMPTCGDEFIEQITPGGDLFFSIRIDFASEMDKKYFEGAFGLSSPPIKITGDLQIAKEKLSKRTQVTIQALQLGGSVHRITEIFGNSEDRMSFVKCSVGEFDKCHNVVRSALDYATDTKNGFPAQIDPKLALGSSDGPAALIYLTKSYVTAGLYPKFPPHLEEAIRKSRKELGNLFEEHYTYSTSAENLLRNKSMRLSEGQKARLARVKLIADQNIQKILETSGTCYENPKECPASVMKLGSDPDGLVKFDAEMKADYLIRPEIFSQFCDLTRLPQPDAGLKKTVDAIIQVARSIDKASFEIDGALDECTVAEDVIGRVKQLELRNKGLTDLRPLASFVQLEAINLSGNEIDDISPLSAMTDLKSLHLSGNKVVNVNPLTKLTNLQWLDLSENRVEDSMPLAALTRLKRLDLRNNHSDVQCPIAREKCLLGDFSTTNSFVSFRLGPVPRSQHSASRLANGEILLTGGNETSQQAQIYDLNGKMVSTKGAMLTRRRGHTSSTLPGGDALIAGGWGLSDGELYQASTGTFVAMKGKMSSPRAFHTATPLPDGTVLLAGGWGSKAWTGSERDALATAEIFNPKTGMFEAVGAMKFRRAEHQATLLKDGTVLITGGFTANGGLATAEIYDPKERVFRHANSRMSQGRAAHTATILPDGSVLLAGGWWREDNLSHQTAELYEPAHGQFRPLRDEKMIKGRSWHTATLLSDGRVLLAGGLVEWSLDAETKQLDEAEIFDPQSRLFSSIPKKMGAARAFHTATPIDDFMVLLVGGASRDSSLTADIYEYRR